ncbi:hypothetical protein [Massilia sp. S19_KUP03_FR1]|uniref:hypothetical protein n=1 Tax=Massilia sp. S19_KUP03_FR1 TaxID=3025503 RepID=UPI002FCDC034
MTLSTTPAATPSPFQALLDEVRSDDTLLEHLQNDDEAAYGPFQDDEDEKSKTVTPPISNAAIDLIVTFEVSSREVYKRKYRHPIWPRGRSGITIGIGYDVGYVTQAVLARDWSKVLTQADLNALNQACGVTGASASALVQPLAHIDIPYSDAFKVFTDVSVVSYTGLTTRSLANTEALHPDSLGALVSLVYNRGASFQREGERYREMRAIRAAMQAQDFAAIPAQIRSMKRIWAGEPDSAGLVKRRELEARLFERGLVQG